MVNDVVLTGIPELEEHIYRKPPRRRWPWRHQLGTTIGQQSAHRTSTTTPDLHVIVVSHGDQGSRLTSQPAWSLGWRYELTFPRCRARLLHEGLKRVETGAVAAVPRGQQLLHGLRQSTSMVIGRTVLSQWSPSSALVPGASGRTT